MKNFLLAVSLLLLVSCSYFRENYKEVNFKMESGASIRLIIYEQKSPFSENSLVVYGNEYPLRGRACEDSELKAFSSQLWTEIAKQDDLSKLNSGTIHLLKKQNQATPEYCNFTYSRKDSGEWIQN